MEKKTQQINTIRKIKMLLALSRAVNLWICNPFDLLIAPLPSELAILRITSLHTRINTIFGVGIPNGFGIFRVHPALLVLLVDRVDGAVITTSVHFCANKRRVSHILRDKGTIHCNCQHCYLWHRVSMPLVYLEPIAFRDFHQTSHRSRVYPQQGNVQTTKRIS